MSRWSSATQKTSVGNIVRELSGGDGHH